jgi:hypothetical protein
MPRADWKIALEEIEAAIDRIGRDRNMVEPEPYSLR